MALNEPGINEEDVEFIIDNWIDNLVSKLRKLKYNIERNDIECEFFSRCEYLGVRSDKIYPNEDLPKMFGASRGYNGGGMHSSLMVSQIHNMSPRKQAKASRTLGLFYDCFNNIMNDIDKASGVEEWEKVGI